MHTQVQRFYAIARASWWWWWWSFVSCNRNLQSSSCARAWCVCCQTHILTTVGGGVCKMCQQWLRRRRKIHALNCEFPLRGDWKTDLPYLFEVSWRLKQTTETYCFKTAGTEIWNWCLTLITGIDDWRCRLKLTFGLASETDDWN